MNDVKIKKKIRSLQADAKIVLFNEKQINDKLLKNLENQNMIKTKEFADFLM